MIKVFKVFPILIILLIGLAGPATAAPPPQKPTDQQLIDQLKQATQNKVRISYHFDTGKVSFIGTEPTQMIPRPGFVPAQASPEEAARGFLTQYGQLFGLRDAAGELSLMEERPEKDGRVFVRFQQRYHNIPIVAGELIVQMNNNRDFISANGEILPELDLDTNPAISADAARQIALDKVAKDNNLNSGDLTATAPELWIYNPVLLRNSAQYPSALVWRLEVTPRAVLPIREFVLVDARRGSIPLQFNRIDNARNRMVYDCNGGTSCATLARSEGQPATAITDVNQAYDYSGNTYDFYLNQHGRDSLDNAGMTLISWVRYSNMQNAYWDGIRMVYGPGFTVDDVVGHELTHGVTEFTSNLFYYYQSGAINESFSDVWGEFIDQTNGAGTDTAAVKWLLGEDVPGGGAIRDMEDPTVFGDPDRMTSTNYYTGASDNGGVHFNSGINNKAVFLMTDGGVFNGQTVTGLGITKVAKIYYETQTHLLVSGADYADLYNLVYQACVNLIGISGITSSNCQEVRDATNAVEMNQQPVPDYNTDAPLCPSGSPPYTDLFLDNMESGLSANWTSGAISGSNRWQWDSPYGIYAHSGLHFLYADDYPATTSDSYIAMKNSITLPSEAFLHFSHAYGFEAYYDGGVLEYSTNGGASWSDAGNLFDYNGYDGTLSASDPLGSRSAFLDDSHGYIASRLNLTPLAGQSVRFRWRMGTDSSVSDWGWWVDDVRIYTCNFEPPSLHNVYLPLVIKGCNCDFESGLTSWTRYSTHGWPIITTGFPGTVRPHSGSWAAWLGGDYSDISYIQQQFAISPSSPYLAYWHWIASADVCGYDYGGVLINNTVVNVYDLCSSVSTGGWVKHVVNLGAYAGQSVSVQIRVETDSSLNSNLFVDDVSFQSTSATALETSGPGSPPAFGPEDTLLKVDKLSPANTTDTAEPEFLLRPENWTPKDK